MAKGVYMLIFGIFVGLCVGMAIGALLVLFAASSIRK